MPSPTDTSAPSAVSARRVRAKLAGADWFNAVESSGDDVAEGAANRRRLDDFLRDALGAEQLVVLTGLGTSLDLERRGPAGETEPVPAPTMRRLYEAVELLPGFAEAAALSPEAVEDRNVEALLSACQFRLALGAEETIAEFLAAAEKSILILCNFIDERTDLDIHQLFLRKVARRQPRLSRTQLFTTNYDLAFEAAARGARFNVIDGFGFGGSQAFDGSAFDLDVVRRHHREALTLEPNVFHLLKLHGSVDWNEVSGEVYRSPAPHQPVLIYPAQSKFQLAFRSPYLESMSRLQMALRMPDVTLIIVGFGFNDAHITAPIDAAVRANVGLRVVAASPSIASSARPTVQSLARLLEAGDRRHALIEATFKELVGLLPETSGRDDREVHDKRVADIRHGE